VENLTISEGKPVGECLQQAGTHAQMNRHVENMMPPAAHVLGGGRIKIQISADVK